MRNASLGWLRLAESDPVAAMRDFLPDWYGPLGPGDGVDAEPLEGRALPAALRALHATIGNRPDLLAGQNRFLPLSDLEPGEDGLLTFYVENQDNFRARVDPHGCDQMRAAVIAPLQRVPLAPWRYLGAHSRQALRYLRDIDGWEALDD